MRFIVGSPSLRLSRRTSASPRSSEVIRSCRSAAPLSLRRISSAIDFFVWSFSFDEPRALRLLAGGGWWVWRARASFRSMLARRIRPVIS
jgi:hypothetical protein